MLRTAFGLLDNPSVSPESETSAQLFKENKKALIYSVHIGRPRHVKSKPAPKATSQPQPALHTFSYARQLTTGRTIRLVQLMPGSPADKVSCSFSYVNLDENTPKYSAISYCWGTSPPSVEIDCEDQTLLITATLASALVAFRRADTPVLVWADALSINQLDIAEKNCQLPLMRHIYEQCSATLVWLGEDDREDSCARAFRLLKSLAKLAEVHGMNANVTKLALERRLSPLGVPDFGHPDWKCIRDILERPWFSRLWIVQEVAVSPKSMLHYGHSTLAWSDFRAGLQLFAVRILPLRVDAVPFLAAFAQAIQLLGTCHLTAERRESLDLLSILDRQRTSHATDPRDKVFGLLGLYESASGREADLSPDYGEDVKLAFTKAAIYIIKTGGNLDILSIPRLPSPLAAQGLPSWAPDWTSSDLAVSLCVKDASGQYVFPFNAAPAASSEQIRIESGILRVRGHEFDHIEELGDLLDPFPGQAEFAFTQVQPLLSLVVRFLAVFKTWENVSRHLSNDAYPGGGTMREAFIRTLLLNDFTGGMTYEQVTEQLQELKPRMRLALRAYIDYSRHVVRLTGWLERVMPFMYIARLRSNPAQEAKGRTQMNPDMVMRLFCRRMLRTKRGYIGLAPRMAEKGDSVFLVTGSRVPLVMRPCADGWKLIGDAYIHGIMQGEAFNNDHCRDLSIL